MTTPALFRGVLWAGVAITGAAAFGGIALNRGESINALWFVVAAVSTYLIGYRFYSGWLAARVCRLDATRATPAERLDNGRDGARPSPTRSRRAFPQPARSREPLLPR